jgi:hypothetical protein
MSSKEDIMKQLVGCRSKLMSEKQKILDEMPEVRHQANLEQHKKSVEAKASGQVSTQESNHFVEDASTPSLTKLHNLQRKVAEIEIDIRNIEIGYNSVDSFCI